MGCPHVRCFSRVVCAWPCLLRQVGTALSSPCDCTVTRITYANHGSRQIWYQSRTVCRIIKPWSKSSLAFYSYIVTQGIREQRKASFSPYAHRSEFWVTLTFSTG